MDRSNNVEEKNHVNFKTRTLKT